jgi:HipA-like protein
VLLNDFKVGTIVRTPGDFNAFSFEESYRATGGFLELSLSFRAVTGGLRKDPKPVARALPAFFANLLPEDKLREAMKSTTPAAFAPGTISICLSHSGRTCLAPSALCRARERWCILTIYPFQNRKPGFRSLVCR